MSSTKTAIVVLSDPKGGEEALGRVFNALAAAYDFKQKRQDVQVLFQGTGTRWAALLTKPDHPVHALYKAVEDTIAGVSTACHQYPADARGVVARVEGVPAVSEIRFEPAREVHGSGYRRDSNIAEIAGAVARRNVHAATERDGEVSVVSANAAPLVVGLQSGSRAPRVLVAEFDVAVDEVADAVKRINADYAKHSRAARKVAREVFEAESVLESVLDRAGI